MFVDQVEQLKPLTEFVEDSYGLNTFVEACLKIGLKEKAFTLYASNKHLSNSNTVIALIKNLGFEPDSKEKIFELIEERKSDETFVNSLLETLLKSK